MPLGSPRELARLARRTYLETLRRGAGELVSGCVEGARALASQPQPLDPVQYGRRRDLVIDLPRFEAPWRQGLLQHLDDAIQAVSSDHAPLTRPAGLGDGGGQFSLVEDAVIELDMMVSRLGHRVADRAGSEFTDLTSRLATLEQGAQGAPDRSGEVLKPAVLARWVVDAWMSAAIGLEHFKTLLPVLQEEVAHLAEEAYHEANRILLDHGVRPEIDLRPFIRRTQDSGVVRPMVPSAGVGNLLARGGGGGLSGTGGLTGAGGGVSAPDGGRASGGASGGAGGGDGGGGGGAGAGSGSGSAQGTGGGLTGYTNRVTGPGRLAQREAGESERGPQDETRLMTQAPGLRLPGGQQKGQAVLGKLNQLVARQVPDFDPTERIVSDSQRAAVTPALGEAIASAQREVQSQAQAASDGDSGHLVRDLQVRNQALKQAASTPAERATIEIVALLFQSILTEERLPASVRVWFARLQMPVLRVAVTEPDFFATLDHPARLLIDRMGACVMGFAGASDGGADDLVHKEVKRIVQTVEAYPDTGRRVFQTVLIEFEKFLVHYFRDDNEASRKGVSLAQQLEQREAYAIQYTIELRKMLEGVPVHDGVREFLYKVWADVIAQSAVQSAPSAEDTKALMRLAGELIWSASAKTTREERHEVLQRLPPLLRAIRAGMARAGLAADRQEAHIKTLNAALSAAFSAKSAAISPGRLRAITQRLEALDEVLPELGDINLDTDTLRDLSGYESDDLEVVADGGTMATPAMMSWAHELKLGSWMQLDYRGRQEPVQLAWRGLQKQLVLFVTPHGRGVLFQAHRLAAFLQAGLLVPADEESLTVRATRDALAKLDADPERLLN